MNPMTRILILALITVSLGVVSYPSHAFPLNGSIEVYFDASGAFIGQHVVYCNGTNNRREPLSPSMPGSRCSTVSPDMFRATSVSKITPER